MLVRGAERAAPAVRQSERVGCGAEPLRQRGEATVALSASVPHARYRSGAPRATARL